MTEETEYEVTAAVIEAARNNPGGWVYKIEGAFGPDEYVPPEAIVGAWKVNDQGKLTGEFLSNPRYRPHLSESEPDEA